MPDIPLAGMTFVKAWNHRPSWTGGVARSAGVVVQKNSLNHHPFRSIKGCFAMFLDVA
jgi:hypothetical protein